jgi:hypothetical protein
MPTWTIHVLGNIGVVLILAAYFLVSNGRTSSTSPMYQWLNLVGAAILIVYSFALFAWASVTLNCIWLLIALTALVKKRRRRSTQATP